MAEAGGPLAGVRVIDLTVNILGPVCTQILGDMGADVVKVEPPEGDPIRQVGPARSRGMGAFFLNTNRNKRGIVLDLKTPQGHAALLRLIEGADVFVHNMRMSAADRLGLGWATLRHRNPRLVHACGTGFRKDSRRRDRPAFDDVVQGMTGIADLHALRDGEPRYVPMVIADKFCGHALAGAIAMALYRRERTGEGQEVHVPMAETMLAFNLMEHLWGATLADEQGRPEGKLGYPRMLTPNRRPYATADGHIALLANTDAQWARFFAVLERPDLAADPRFTRLVDRSRHLDALYGVVEQEVRKRPTAEWERLLDAADIPNGPVLRLEGLLDDAYLAETGFFRRMTHPTEGAMITPAIAPEFSESAPAIRCLAPRLGEHTEEVLREAGFDAEEIAAATRAPIRA
jgi:crotonobetainyl-CoA:carnitine CoA-transferase CaiB-like acyl-CoA transferase